MEFLRDRPDLRLDYGRAIGKQRQRILSGFNRVSNKYINPLELVKMC